MSSLANEFETGEWYYVITCERCKALHKLFHDLNRGRSIAKAMYTWTCPDCGHEGLYDAERVERYYHSGKAPY
jgi:predicted nucleic-acid-binding Zn-ribbon protein